MNIFYFLCYVAVISFGSAFVLSLARKWMVIEWLQVHAPNELLYKLFTCNFCCSFWMTAFVSAVVAALSGEWAILAVPFFATVIVRALW